MRYARIHCDGGARGNPGPGGAGVVIEIGDRVYQYSKYLGTVTNNKAEYLAVLFALEKAREIQVESIDFFLDSELVVNQLNRRYKVKDKDLAGLFVKVWNLMQLFKKVRFFHVPRKENKQADYLVNKAIDGHRDF